MAAEMQDYMARVQANKPRPARGHRRRPSMARYLQPFALKQHRDIRETDKEFFKLGQSCQNLLHDCYEFQLGFGLRPEEFTEVAAVFCNQVDYNIRDNRFSFGGKPLGIATLRLNDGPWKFKGQAHTSSGLLSGFLSYGPKHSSVYTRASVNLDSGSYCGGAGFAMNWHDSYLCADFDPSDLLGKIGVTAVLALQRGFTIGVKSQPINMTGGDIARDWAGRLAYKSVSLSSAYHQPQDFEVCLGFSKSGQQVDLSYVQHMMVPWGGVLHRFAMGGEYVHDSGIRRPMAVDITDTRIEFSNESRAVVASEPIKVNQLCVGCSWQPMENFLVKLRAMSSGNMGLLLAFRTWSDPRLTLAVSVQARAADLGSATVGLCVNLDNH